MQYELGPVRLKIVNGNSKLSNIFNKRFQLFFQFFDSIFLILIYGPRIYFSWYVSPCTYPELSDIFHFKYLYKIQICFSGDWLFTRVSHRSIESFKTKGAVNLPKYYFIFISKRKREMPKSGLSSEVLRRKFSAVTNSQDSITG